jgi:uncharacterized protein YggU (UPF0235/DUF167 family)
VINELMQRLSRIAVQYNHNPMQEVDMPAKRKFEITDAKGGAAFTVKVITRAVHTEVVGIQDDGSLKIRLMASPAGDPSANKELIDFLAAQLTVPADRIEIVAGANGREKVIAVEGISTADLDSKFNVDTYHSDDE